MSQSERPGGAEWWRDAVVYQIYPRSFADSDGDGVGDLGGIIGKVPYLDELGVDALWLSPICVSPMADFGYDVSDYCDVDPVFGSLDDVDRLVAALHGRGMRLLLDWVPNHTSDRHPWFVESRSSRRSPKRDWYVWRDRGPDGAPPNNWMATFKGVPAWTHDDTTDQSYLHLFLAEQPDLNWANPEVEAAMHDTLRFWLDRGVDGFRADVVHLIGKGDDVPDLPEQQAHAVVLNVDRPLGHELLHRVRTLLDSYPQQPMMVGEVYLLGEGESAGYVGTPEKPELHLSFDFRPVHTPWDATHFRAQLVSGQADFAEPRWPTWVLSNHDRVRHRTRHGSDARARVAAVMTLTVRGTPFLYAGEELGLEDGVVPADRVVDPDGRDGCRAPIPWTGDGDLEAGHGWGDAAWLPFPANTATNSADRLVGVDGSIHSLYRDLLRLRRDTPALRRGAMTVEEGDDDVIHYRRELEGDVVEIVINMADDPAPWPEGLVGDLLASSDPTRTTSGGSLAGPEAIIIRTS